MSNTNLARLGVPGAPVVAHPASAGGVGQHDSTNLQTGTAGDDGGAVALVSAKGGMPAGPAGSEVGLRVLSFRGGEQDAGVDHGSSHGSSKRSTGRRLRERLRRSLAEASATLVGGLSWLRIAGIAILVVTAALGIATTVFVDSQFSVYARTLDGCAGANELLESSVTATRGIRYLIQCQREWINCTAGMVEAERGVIIGASDAFTARHRALYRVAQKVGYQESYEAPTVPVNWYEMDSTGTTLVETVHVTPLYEAGLQLAGNMFEVASLPLANITRGVPLVEYVLSNAFAGWPIHDALNATIYAWLEQSSSVHSAVTATALYVYIAMSVLVAVLGTAVVLPILLHVDFTRDRYLLPLIALPTVVPSKLRADAEARLKKMRAADADDEDGDSTSEEEVVGFDDDGDGESEGAGSALHGALARRLCLLLGHVLCGGDVAHHGARDAAVWHGGQRAPAGRGRAAHAGARRGVQRGHGGARAAVH